MRVNQFINNNEVILALDDLKNHFENSERQLIVSDVLDEKGCQYVDLVQEGGGILGIALIGYLYVMEEMGIRFLNVAGASAGSITTLLMCSLGKTHERKTDKLIEILSNKNFYDFVDGDKDAKKFIKAIIEKAGKFRTIFRGLKILDNLKRDMGLNPGDHFLKWLKKVIADYGISDTQALLENIRELPPGIKLRNSSRLLTEKDLDVKIKLIASELTTNTKVILPEMAELYYKDYLLTNPAEYVRASVSIPIFFAPFKIKDIPVSEDETQQLKWQEIAKYKGPIPKEVYMVDGGVMSNFPIDVFHRHFSIPRKPTFGIKLGLERNEINNIENYFHLIYSSFESARQIRDFEFIFNNDDFTQLVTYIDLGEFNWLNFDISEEEKIKLFVEGVKAACNFLKNFDWEGYKQLRKNRLINDTRNIVMAQ